MKALIVVDVQKDFCEGGALGVAGGHNASYWIARHIYNHHQQYQAIVHTMDWHRPWPDTNGGHFSMSPDYVDSWPIHCMANSEGAELHEAQTPVDEETTVFYKGYGQPHYSGFSGMNLTGLYLGEYLDSLRIKEVELCGIAGNYCVLQTGLDAKRKGLKATMLPDLIASIGGRIATERAIAQLDEFKIGDE